MDILLDKFAKLCASDEDSIELGKREVKKINLDMDAPDTREAYRIVIEKVFSHGENELGRAYFYEVCGRIGTVDICGDEYSYYFLP